MPEANSIPVLANRVGPYPGHAPGATVKPKLLDCLREALRSRHSFARYLLEFRLDSKGHPMSFPIWMRYMFGHTNHWRREKPCFTDWDRR
jgi:hypothetical protein